MNPYRAAVRALGTTRGFTWVAARVLPPIDARFRGRRRSLTSLGTGLPLCYLTTTGRRSGESRVVPLLYLADGERIVLFASNWGRSGAPGVGAQPRRGCGGGRRDRRGGAADARAPGDERGGARYWPGAEEMYPGYAGYRRRAGRTVRVFVLEPRGSTG